MYRCFHKKTTEWLLFGILISKLSSIDAQRSVFCTYYLYKNSSKNKIFLVRKYILLKYLYWHYIFNNNTYNKILYKSIYEK